MVPKGANVLMVETYVSSEEVELPFELIENLCPLSAGHLADHHPVKVLVRPAVTVWLYSRVVVALQRFGRQLA